MGEETKDEVAAVKEREKDQAEEIKRQKEDIEKRKKIAERENLRPGEL